MRSLKSRRAAKNIMTVVAKCRKGADRRTAHSALPKTAVVDPIIQAIIGGFEKYPKAGSCDHAQYWASSPCKPQGAVNKIRSRSPNKPIRMRAKVLAGLWEFRVTIPLWRFNGRKKSTAYGLQGSRHKTCNAVCWQIQIFVKARL